MKGFLQIARLAFTYKRAAILVIVSNFFFVVFNLLSLILFVPFLKIIFDPEHLDELQDKPAPNWETAEGSFEYFGDLFNHYQVQYVREVGVEGALAFVCISVIIAFFFKNLSRYSAVYQQAFLRVSVVRDLRARLFEQSMRLPLSFYSEEKKGDLLSRMTSDLTEIEVAVICTLELIFREPLAIAVNLAVLFYFSPELTLFSLILMPISALIISRIGRSLKRTSVKGQEQMGEVLSNIEESIGGVRIIKAFTAEKFAMKRFSEKNNHHQKLLTRAWRKKDMASPLGEFMGAIVLVSLVGYGGSMILNNEGDLSGTTFITFIIIFSQLLRPISSIASSLAALKKAEASLDRVNEILEIENNIIDPENPVQKNSFDGAIKFKNVTFSYGEEDVLKNVSFIIEKGQTVALVGESGSGKSTIADLIPRFHDVQSGEIKIDEVNVRDMLKADLRKMISMVTQESILFNDSIKNSIAFGNPDSSDEEIIEAAKIANAHNFIINTENGYETNIGDGGNKLSGGQRQRLSIARAVLTNAPIMILDEATSSLDTESEKLVQDALNKIMQDRTSLVIAHRLSTIRSADLIIVLRDGQIVESGSHDELIGKSGYYKSLCEIQQVI